jgi:deazaflavin-dependent oxidoreductase (nitroreductase family)
VIDLGFRALNRTHRTILHVTRGRVGGSAFGMPVVELFTVGRRSGQTRSTLLTAPVVVGEQIVLVASKGGDERDPDWYQNIVAQPDVEVVIARKRQRMRARVATTSEQAELWPRVEAAFRPYGHYRRISSRDIPLVICEPR